MKPPVWDLAIREHETRLACKVGLQIQKFRPPGQLDLGNSRHLVICGRFQSPSKALLDASWAPLRPPLFPPKKRETVIFIIF